MPDSNGNRTNTEWFIHLDQKITEGFVRIDDKLDTKANVSDVGDIEKRVRSNEETLTRHRTIGGIATAVITTLTGLLGIKII